MDRANNLRVNQNPAPHPFTIRIRGLPHDESAAREVVHRLLVTRGTQALDDDVFIVPACEQENTATALVKFHSGLPDFLADTDQISELVDNVNITLDRHFSGFTQLSHNTEPIQADVVVIGGIGGHAYGSWQSREYPNPMFLRDFLPKDFPSCRIMTWGYRGTLRRLDIAILKHYAQEFLQDLKRVRMGEARNRPVVFLAHSYGGIVLVRALLRADRDARSDPSLTALLEALLGVMFFAVPHSGMDVDNISQIIGPQDHPRQDLIQYISNKSKQVKELQREFIDFVFGHEAPFGKCKVVSFFEMEPSQLFQQDENGKWQRSDARSLLLEESDAVLGLPSNMETTFGFHKDHSSIIKISSIHDDEYKRICQELGALLAPVIGPGSFHSSRRLTNDFPPSASVSRAPTYHLARIPSDESTGRRSGVVPSSTNLSTILVRVILVSATAVATVSLIPDRNAITWPRTRKDWAFWGLAVPAVVFATTYEYTGATTVSGSPRENSRD